MIPAWRNRVAEGGSGVPDWRKITLVLSSILADPDLTILPWRSALRRAVSDRGGKAEVSESSEEEEAAELREEEEVRAELRSIVEDLDRIRAQLVDLHGRLPVPVEETAMLVGEIEMDFATEVRSVIECVLNDSIRPAIRDLAKAASYQPKRRGGG